MSVRFTQSCPTCGRRVQIRASLMGFNVACQHCKAQFIASADIEGSTPNVSPETSDDPLMARVEQALQRAATQSTVIS